MEKYLNHTTIIDEKVCECVCVYACLSVCVCMFATFHTQTDESLYATQLKQL